MRQHISIEQLNELSEKGKKRLVKWWKPKQGDLVLFMQGALIATIYPIDWTNEELKNKKPIENQEFPLLSIGQMIEFLDEHTDLESEDSHFPMKEISWRTDIYPELCDSLWEAVKEILETDG